MSEQIYEQISAFLDDELSAEESAFLVRRLTSDAIARDQTIRYATIGSILREESVLPNSTILRDRIHAALDGAPMGRSELSRTARRNRQWTRMLAAASVAGFVAVMSLLGLRTLNDDVSRSPRVQTITAAPGVWAEPDSYVVPGEILQATQLAAPPIRLTNYLMQHGNYASTLNRTSVHSNVIGKRESDVSTETIDAGEPSLEAESP